MFGMGFFEIVVIVIVAIIFLGPDKLPQAIVDVAKFFKVVKKTIHDAKQTIDSELNLSALQQEAINYHQHFTSQVDTITKDMQLQEIDEIFSEYKALPPAKDSDSKKDSLESSAIDSSLAQESPKASKASIPSKKPKAQEKTIKKSSMLDKKSKKSAKQARKTPHKLDSTTPAPKRTKSTKPATNKV